MDRRAFLRSAAIALIGSPLAAAAAEVRKIPKVAILSISTGSEPIDIAFAAALRELGWVAGRNVVIDSRYLAGRTELFAGAAAELVHLQPDVIVAWAPAGVSAAKNATQVIPIVGVTMGDPVITGWAASRARPGGQVTGIASYGEELIGKGLELAKEALGTVTRIALLTNPSQVFTPAVEREAAVAAQALKLQVEIFRAARAADLEDAFRQISQWQPSALVVQRDAVFWAHRAEIVALSARNRLPALYLLREFADAGGLMTFGPSLIDMARRAAVYVDKILKGANAGDLPIEGPMRYELIINLKTAKALGLTIPQSLLLRADELIQ